MLNAKKFKNVLAHKFNKAAILITSGAIAVQTIVATNPHIQDLPPESIPFQSIGLLLAVCATGWGLVTWAEGQFDLWGASRQFKRAARSDAGMLQAGAEFKPVPVFAGLSMVNICGGLIWASDLADNVIARSPVNEMLFNGGLAAVCSVGAITLALASHLQLNAALDATKNRKIGSVLETRLSPT